nr:MAG TPA: hypothetical protein [Caudoviricetes sp.]
MPFLSLPQFLPTIAYPFLLPGVFAAFIAVSSFYFILQDN